MIVEEVIKQIVESNGNNGYQYHCCDCVFDSFYEFRKHLFENHPQEYIEIEPCLHRVKPIQMTKEERKSSIKKALKRKEKAKGKHKKVRERGDYSKQPSAWILYHHNGSK